MFDLSELSMEELLDLRFDVFQRLNELRSQKHHPNMTYYEKVKYLREQLSKLENKEITINIDGEDTEIRLYYPQGFRVSIEGFDSNPDPEQYNEEHYDELFILANTESQEGTNTEDFDDDFDEDIPTPTEPVIENFLVPLFFDFICSPDANILKDEPDEELEYDPEDVSFVIRMDTLDYVFTGGVLESDEK